VKPGSGAWWRSWSGGWHASPTGGEKRERAEAWRNEERRENIVAWLNKRIMLAQEDEGAPAVDIIDRNRRACLLVNPGSGGCSPQVHGDQVAEIWAALRAAGIWAEIIETKVGESPATVARRAADEGFSMVIAGGGDGTVGATAQGLVGTNCPLGILPMGTYNNFARALGLPQELRAACRVDVGVANDEHYFFEAAGIGIDAELFPLGEEIKCGHWSRLWQVAQLAYRAEPARIHFELNLPLADAYHESSSVSRFASRAKPFARDQHHGLDFSAFLLIIANARYYGGGFTVAPDAVLDDGLLNIRIFRNFSKRQLLQHFWCISQRRYGYSPKIDTFTASEVTITAQTDLPFHVEGRPVGRLPVRIRSLPRALRVLG
jgi:diacylglycerol kinase (ATP)